MCQEQEVPFDLLARLLEVEKQSIGMTRRASVQKALGSVLNREWGSEEEIIEKRARQLSLVEVFPKENEDDV